MAIDIKQTSAPLHLGKLNVARRLAHLSLVSRVTSMKGPTFLQRNDLSTRNKYARKMLHPPRVGMFGKVLRCILMPSICPKLFENGNRERRDLNLGYSIQGQSTDVIFAYNEQDIGCYQSLYDCYLGIL